MVLGGDGVPLDTDEAGMLQEKEVRSGEVGGRVASTFSWAAEHVQAQSLSFGAFMLGFSPCHR